jgi:hypothetical protein
MTRNGIGGYPARIVISINGNGLGTGEQAPGTLTIFRDTTVYVERPSDLYTHPRASTIEYAQYWYDKLRPIWQRNRADYYTITNEGVGHDPAEIHRHIAYQRNIATLANRDGLRVVVGKLAVGTPHWDLWRQYYAPFVVEAWESGRNIYGRHIYGGGDLVDSNGRIIDAAPNHPVRILHELDALRSMGYGGGVVIAECGLDGGVGVVDWQRFHFQATKFEQALRPYADILIGLCWWELGNTEFRADYTARLRELRPYAEVNQLGKWEPSGPQPPPDERHRAIVVKAPQEIGAAEWLTLASYAYQFRHTMTASHDDAVTVLKAGNEESYAKIYKPTLASQQATIAALEANGLKWEPLTLGTTPPPKPPPSTAVDMLPYLRGDGTLYEVRHPNGNQERFQTQSQGETFYLAKNSQYETLHYDDKYIWRSVDTSPGPAPEYAERPGQPRWYTQFTSGTNKARWCYRFMRVGETFVEDGGHTVQYYYKSDCTPSAANSGAAVNRVTFVAQHATMVWNGITVSDVVELSSGTERFWFARGLGLVAWSSPWGTSAVSEIHAPGARPDNVRETGCFS